MGKRRLTPFMDTVTSLVALVTVGWWSSPAQASTRTPQEAQETIAAPSLLSQPDARRERQLRDDLEAAVERYRADKSSASQERCELRLEKILALPTPGAKAYSLCATAANVLDRPRQAIEILRKAMAQYPEEHVWGPILPLRISGYYRIGAIATRIGNVDEATRAYETIISNVGSIESKEYHKVQCYMYFADTVRRMPGKRGMAAERLREVMSVMANTDIATRHSSGVIADNVLKDWATYELAKLEHDTVPADLRPDPNRAQVSATYMAATTWAIIKTTGRAGGMRKAPERGHRVINRTSRNLAHAASHGLLALGCIGEHGPRQILRC